MIYIYTYVYFHEHKYVYIYDHVYNEAFIIRDMLNINRKYEPGYVMYIYLYPSFQCV